MQTKAQKRKATMYLNRVAKTLEAANGIDGKGMVLAVVWGTEYAGFDQRQSGVVVRQTQHGMDAVGVRLMTEGFIKFLGKLRVVLP